MTSPIPIPLRTQSGYSFTSSPRWLATASASTRPRSPIARSSRAAASGSFSGPLPPPPLPCEGDESRIAPRPPSADQRKAFVRIKEMKQHSDLEAVSRMRLSRRLRSTPRSRAELGRPVHVSATPRGSRLSVHRFGGLPAARRAPSRRRLPPSPIFAEPEGHPAMEPASHTSARCVLGTTRSACTPRNGSLFAADGFPPAANSWSEPVRCAWHGARPTAAIQSTSSMVASPELCPEIRIWRPGCLPWCTGCQRAYVRCPGPSRSADSG